MYDVIFRFESEEARKAFMGQLTDGGLEQDIMDAMECGDGPYIDEIKYDMGNGGSNHLVTFVEEE